MKEIREHPPLPARRKILILEDHPVTRYGLSQLIGRQPDLQVCAEAQDAQQAMEAVRSEHPDLVLADITLPGKSGLQFVREVGAQFPGVMVLAISMHDESLYAERVLRAGGRGYIMKSEGGERVLEAIRQVLRGQVYVSQNMTAALLDVLTRRPIKVDTAVPGALSDREFEVFQLIGQGLSTRQAGQRLSLSAKTIGTHRSHIMKKLNLKSGPELIKEAVRWAASEQLI